MCKVPTVPKYVPVVLACSCSCTYFSLWGRRGAKGQAVPAMCNAKSCAVQQNNSRRNPIKMSPREFLSFFNVITVSSTLFFYFTFITIHTYTSIVSSSVFSLVKVIYADTLRLVCYYHLPSQLLKLGVVCRRLKMNLQKLLFEYEPRLLSWK